MTMPEAFDPMRILAGLRAHGVDYVLIGGLAAAARGSPVDTDDVDICLAPDEQNLDRLGLALMDLGASPTPDDDGEADHVTFMTIAGRLDCLEFGDGYAGLSARAEQLDLGLGIVARVASLEDLGEMKRTSGDLSGAAHLAALAAPALVKVEQGEAQDEREITIESQQPAKRGAFSRMLDKLERVDTFLTDLNNGELGRRKAS